MAGHYGGGGAIVPFNTLGPAADQSAEERLIQVGQGVVLRLRQEPGRAGAVRCGAGGGAAGAALALADGPRDAEGGGVHWPHDEPPAGAGAAAAPAAGVLPGQQDSALANVGLVVWQSGYVLAELLLRCPPLGPWSPGTHVMDLGTGTGLVGLALSAAGARATLTDLPHITPLARANAAANAPHGAGHVLAPRVLEYAWGDPVGALLAQAGGRPDVITASDVLYDAAMRPPLLAALRALCAPHTLTFIAYRKRRAEEERFAAEAEAAGFAVAQVPPHMLAPEYQDGTYVVLRLAVRDAADVEMCVAGDNDGVSYQQQGQAAAEGCDGDVSGEEELEQEDVEHRPCAQQ